MYFVISVFPISMTSGALPPASVASNFARWVPHVWYWTSTFHARVLGLELSVRRGHDLRPTGLASIWSQTVRVFARTPTRRARDTDSYDRERGDERSCGEYTYVHSHLPRHLGARSDRSKEVWQRPVGAPKWFVPICHGREASTSRAPVKPLSITGSRRERPAQQGRASKRVSIAQLVLTTSRAALG